MYFKRLELVGFKSFCNKTTLDFEPGVTAVVGPNGCGKSNIFDSIRWVLGEQSVKALRGSQMEDVIFNGTDTKEPVGMAEVTLAFDNRARFFSVDHDEVAITRRLFRSGESEYLLNKATVRLKDISDLLLGTGIGAESYSLIQQGKIDLVLSSRPEERRMVFDEASGITKYKAQKKEALRKLEETEQNLLRLNDIITEVKRQIGSLERQASKARRYKEVFEELKTKEVSLGFAQKKEITRQKDEILRQLTHLGSEEARILEAIKEQEGSISNRREELQSLENNIKDIQSQILNLENLLSRNKERITYNRDRILELGTNKKYLEEQIEQTRSRLLLDEEKFNKVNDEYEGIRKEISLKSEILAVKENSLNELGLRNKASLESIALAKKDILDLAAKISGSRNEIIDLASKQQICLARKKRLEIERAKVIEEKAMTEDSLTSIEQEVEGLEEVFAALNSQLSGIKSESENESLSLNSLDSKIGDLDMQRLTLESQKAFLEELKTKYEDISESMNAVIYLDKPPAEKMSGLVIKVKEYLNDAQSNGLKLSGEAKPIDLDTQRIIEKLSRIQDEIDALKRDKAQRQTHIEELKASIAEKQEALRSQEMVLVNKKASQQSIIEQLSKIKDEEEIIALELQDVDKEVQVLGSRLSALKAALLDLDKQQKAREELIVTEQNNISVNSSLKEEMVVIITQTKTEVDALNKRIITDGATLKILQDTYEQDKTTLSNIERQIKETEDKSSSLELEISDFEKEISEADQKIREQDVSLKEAQGRYAQMSGDSEGIIKKIEHDKAELDELKNKLYELQMQGKDIDFKWLSLKERLLQSYKIDMDAESGLPQEETLDVSAPEPDESLLSEEIQKLKEKLDSYGTVNLVAIEEYDELKKRYDFLTQQQNDLVTAKDSLQEAIQKINRTTKKMFLETFEKVREEFRTYFKLLFNGGDAQVYLIDEQDPLESGIEIICRPPGKKLQNVLLLSGGEKSMAAIALIFAIFKVKPAPFCVLDEIDAALDEANVDRFGRMLQEFAKISQFIVITHNKKTIANADVMYGITMEESGVSKIVSVKFSQNKTAAAVKASEADSVEPVNEPV